MCAMLTQPIPESRKRFFKSFEAKSLRKRSFLTRISDKLTAFCGSTYFLVFHVIFFAVWILVNTGHIPGAAVYDPFPYGLLTMVVSLEAIFLAIFVLVSQNRQASITTVRDEVNMKVNMIAEEEITKILQVLSEMRTHMGIKTRDEVLEGMLKRTDTGNIEQSIIEQLHRADKPIRKEFTTPIEMLKKPFNHLMHHEEEQKKKKSSPSTKK
jgi:uncharacterized membrane protein